MRPITTVTQFIQELSVALDHGAHYGIDEIELHIENGTLFHWMKLEMNGVGGIDLTWIREEEQTFLLEKYQAWLGGYAGQERRKWGIENNGLCLLISWGTEILRHLD